MKFLDSVQARAAASLRKIVFAEGSDPRTRAAVAELARRRIVDPIVVLSPARP
jgi:phosphotransacetylase